MAKDKDRALNPAAAQRKADKAREIKKSKADLQARRNEKLARRNPDRLQRQIEDLKALEASGEIKSREKQILADLERDVKAIKKAREVLGDKAPHLASNRQPTKPDHTSRSVLGKRSHDGDQRPRYPQQEPDSSGSETDESVRAIPLPHDTPPPIPRSSKHHHQNRPRNPNQEPVSNHREREPQAHPQTPIQAQTTYSSAPQLRDLKKEAISRFVPDIVRRKQQAVAGTGSKLLEPEEMDRLEAAGYWEAKGVESMQGGAGVEDAAAAAGEEEIARRLRQEEERFQMELKAEEQQPADNSAPNDVIIKKSNP